MITKENYGALVGRTEVERAEQVLACENWNRKKQSRNGGARKGFQTRQRLNNPSPIWALKWRDGTGIEKNSLGTEVPGRKFQLRILQMKFSSLVGAPKWRERNKFSLARTGIGETVMHKKVFQLLVNNTSGVLSRITGLFSRRGYNIESITAGVTADPRFTRITIVASGDDEILEQIEKQLAKLEDVRDIRELKPDQSVYRELIMIKVRAAAEQRQSIIAVADIFRAKIIDVAPESLMIELTGNQQKIDAFIGLLDGYEILEQARTGIAGLGRGTENIAFID